MIGQPTLTVSQLNEYIRALVAKDLFLEQICLCGEISNFTAHRSGHFYFSLKDEGSVIRAVMFRSAAERVPFTPENGMKVVVKGGVTVYSQGGQYQINVRTMEPDGVGSLASAFEERKKKLAAEGLFDKTRKKPIPQMPRRIGVITSPTGAAVRDILNILGRRYPRAEVVLYPTLVQGGDAPASLIEALHYFDKTKDVDVLIIGRGGGSMEDLFAFNDEGLARTIAACSIPVVSAVGHETDFTIADFVADLRAPTPSAAAEIAVPDQRELARRLDHLHARLRQMLQGSVTQNRRVLAAFLARPVLRNPVTLVENRELMVLSVTERMTAACRRSLAEVQAGFRETTARLHSLSPLGVLSRGYCAAFAEDGHAVSSVSAVQKNDELQFRFADGHVQARIESVAADVTK
ncbi:MAG: exodeoxyribonuclease VII large subunit [Clostridia bacterium]|nr:exodeoxyribonuclease VII large subunit [Clostridia bacterium]